MNNSNKPRKAWTIHFLDRDVIVLTDANTGDFLFQGWVNHKGDIDWSTPHKLSYSVFETMSRLVREQFFKKINSNNHLMATD